MKKISILIALAFLTSMVQGQGLFINKVNKSVESYAINDIDSITFFSSYKTDVDAKKEVGNLYDNYYYYYYGDVVGMSEAFSDDAFAGGDTPKDMVGYVQSENTDFSCYNTEVTGLWQKCYKGIRLANQYLAEEDDILFPNGMEKLRKSAEAKFFRAYNYWELVRHYGWVPIITTVLPTEAAYNAVPQSTPSEVYSQVAADLLAALPNLPISASATEPYQITKGACQALIARIYLYHTGISQIAELGLTPETWGDGKTTINKVFASAQLSAIINSGQYALVANYANIWNWSSQINTESVLTKHYTNLGLSSWSNYLTGVKGNLFTQRCGVREPSPTTFTTHGWSGCTISWDLVNAFGADPRKASTVFDASTQLASYTKAYMNTGYFNRKFMSQTAFFKAGGDPVLNWARDMYDIRYADVLLMAAELNINGNGLQYFNAVRQRSGNAEATSIDQAAILKERRLEFAGEGLRKWDLLRTGLAYAKTATEGSMTNLPGTIPNPADFTGRVFNTGSLGMMPIPAAEITKSNPAVLKQFIPFYFKCDAEITDYIANQIATDVAALAKQLSLIGGSTNEGKTWVLDSISVGHLGYGDSQFDATRYWSAPALDRSMAGCYDDELVLKSNDFSAQLINHGSSYVNSLKADFPIFSNKIKYAKGGYTVNHTPGTDTKWVYDKIERSITFNGSVPLVLGYYNGAKTNKYFIIDSYGANPEYEMTLVSCDENNNWWNLKFITKGFVKPSYTPQVVATGNPKEYKASFASAISGSVSEVDYYSIVFGSGITEVISTDPLSAAFLHTYTSATVNKKYYVDFKMVLKDGSIISNRVTLIVP